MPFPPSLESFMVYAVKDVGLKWWKVCFKENTKSPFQSLWLRMGTFQWCFPWLQGMKASSTPKGTEKPEGSSVQVLHYSFCNMKCLEVLLVPLDGMLVHRGDPKQLPGCPNKLASTIYTLGWRKALQGQGVMSKNMTQRPELDSISDLLLQNPAD